MATTASVKPKKGNKYPVIWIVTFKKAPSAAELRAKKAIVRKNVKSDILAKVRRNKATPGFKIQMAWLRHGSNRKILFVLVHVHRPGTGGGGSVVTPTPPSPPQPKV
jgi:hypothetical protein